MKIFASLLNGGLLLKERICFQREQILSFKSSPHFQRDLGIMELNSYLQHLSGLENGSLKYSGVSLVLNSTRPRYS